MLLTFIGAENMPNGTALSKFAMMLSRLRSPGPVAEGQLAPRCRWSSRDGPGRHARLSLR